MTPSKHESRAREIAEKNWEMLSDRSGFNSLMSNIKYDDSEIYEEIISIWQKEIVALCEEVEREAIKEFQSDPNNVWGPVVEALKKEFERGKSEALASRIVGPNEAKFKEWDENYFNDNGHYPNSSEVFHWYRDNLKTEPAVLVLPKLEHCPESLRPVSDDESDVNKTINEIRRLNPSLKVSVGD